jgi:predicted site-specific integrase-resolvase
MSNNEMRKENDQDGIAIPRLLSAKDVGEILGISAKTVNKLVRGTKLGCVQVTAKERRFTEGQVQAYITARSREVRVDTPRVRQVSSRPKKGGEQDQQAKSFEAQAAGSLVEELKALCR